MRRGEPDRPARRRRERTARPDPLAEALDDDVFWWERV